MDDILIDASLPLFRIAFYGAQGLFACPEGELRMLCICSIAPAACLWAHCRSVRWLWLRGAFGHQRRAPLTAALLDSSARMASTGAALALACCAAALLAASAGWGWLDLPMARKVAFIAGAWMSLGCSAFGAAGASSLHDWRRGSPTLAPGLAAEGELLRGASGASRERAGLAAACPPAKKSSRARRL